jgi:spermidine synthase
MPALLVICFTISGATSLVLQVVWVRRLIGVFGASSLAIATVLATFMAGLALGSWIGGRWADKLENREVLKDAHRVLRDPFFYYGLAELVVAVTALAILPMIDYYRGANAWLWQQLGDTPWLLASTRFALTATVLLIPTTAMGATLPLLTRKVTRAKADLGRLGSRLGLLYAANTLGALFGAAAAGFWFIPLFGVSLSNQIAAGAAGLIALVVALLCFRRKPDPAPDSAPAELGDTEADESDASVPALNYSDKKRRAVLYLYALSGAVAMVLEVLWSRTLAIVNGSSVYSFTIVLCTFLVGISAGSALAARWWAKTRRPLLVLSGLFLFAAAGITLFHALADDLPETFLALVEGTQLDVDTVLTVHVFLSALIIVPTALAMGAVMPVAIRAYVGGMENVGRDVGKAYASNTLGAILGSALGGFVVLPGAGLEWGARLAALVMLGMALWAWWLESRRRVVPILAFVILVAVIVSPSWNRSNFTAGLFRTHQASRYIKDGGLFQRQVVYYRDGISTTVTVEKLAGGWGLRNNGKVKASNRHDMPTQILVGLMPSLFHSSTEQSVFLVGYGSGVTVGSIGIAPMVKEVDVVELEPAVYEAADLYFGDFNNQPDKNPKVRRLLGDGRNVLLAGDKRYDVIVSEPSNPWIAGVATLFTREFYQLAKKNLKPGGVFCQWAQLYELGPRNVKMIYRTFAESFTYVYAFTPGDETTDTILLGSEKPLHLDLVALRRRMLESDALRAELKRAEIETAEDLVASILLGPDEVASFTAGGAINTDDNAKLEYAAPHDLLASANTGNFARLVRGDTWPYGYLEPIVEGVFDGVEGRAELRIARSLMTYGRLRRAKHWLGLADRKGADTKAMKRVLALAEMRDYLDPELSITEGGPTLPEPSAALFKKPSDAAAERLRNGYKLFSEARWSTGWDTLRALPRRAEDSAGSDVTLLMAYFAYKSLELDLARKLLEPLAEHERYRTRRPSLVYYLARAHFGLGHFRDGIELLEEFARRWPELPTKFSRQSATCLDRAQKLL